MIEEERLAQNVQTITMCVIISILTRIILLMFNDYIHNIAVR